jgi:hypothetical protein
MLRNPVSDFSLSRAGQVRGPRPSFRPAVEALEERVVLDATESLTPSSHGPVTQADFFAQDMLRALSGLQNTLQNREQNGPTIKLPFLRNFQKIQNGLRHHLVNLLSVSDTANDPYLVQVATQFVALDQTIQDEWQAARQQASDRANQKLLQAANNLGGKVTQGVVLQQLENKLLQWGSQLAQQAQQFLSGQQQ